MKVRHSICILFTLAVVPGCSDRPDQRFKDQRFKDQRFKDLPEPQGIETKLNRYSVKILENAEQIEVLSLDPMGPPGPNEATFRGYKLLGKTVATEAMRRQIAAAIYASVNQGTASDFCFEPRHAVRASVAGKSLDLVICFECHSMQVYPHADDGSWHYPIGSAAREVLNNALTNAGIPLAPN